MGLGHLNPGCTCCEEGDAPDCEDFAEYAANGWVSDFTFSTTYDDGGAVDECCDELAVSYAGVESDPYQSPFGANEAGASTPGQAFEYCEIEASAIADIACNDDAISIGVAIDIQGVGSVVWVRDFAVGAFHFGVTYTIPLISSPTAGCLDAAYFGSATLRISSPHAP